MNEKNCPFYGRHLHFPKAATPPFVLLDQRGNQCAVITGSYSPCQMEINGQEVDWRKCPVLADVRINFDART